MWSRLHDDRVDDAGEHLLELLHSLLLRGPEESDPELPEQVVGRQRGCKVVLGLESPVVRFKRRDSRWRTATDGYTPPRVARPPDVAEELFASTCRTPTATILSSLQTSPATATSRRRPSCREPDCR